MIQHVRRWLPGRRLVLVVDGSCIAVLLTMACVKSRVTMVSRLLWSAAIYHWPGFQAPGKRGRKPLKGERQRSLQGWVERSDAPWEIVDVDWFGGQRKTLWVFSHAALWCTPGLPRSKFALSWCAILRANETGSVQLQREALDLLIHGFPLAA
jgi:hypothetical protein